MRLIDADKLIDDIKKRGINKLSKGGDEVELTNFVKGLGEAIKIADTACVIDPVKHGHWIHGSNSENIRVTCSECGYKVNYFWDSWQDALHCPKCGAKMDETR